MLYHSGVKLFNGFSYNSIILFINCDGRTKFKESTRFNSIL